MRNILSLNILIFFILFGFFSCKDSDEHRVGSDFTTYVQRFQDEAAKRGRTFDLINGGLIVEFADLKDGVAGLCHYEKPIRVEIDNTYWKAIEKSSNADVMKENLLFHELGHGFLNRKHLNSVLENGDWKSIMCGGDKVNDRSWNINYRGIRREYYLDELFNESTAAPVFSSNQLIVDTLGYKSVYRLNFNSTLDSDAGWPITTKADYTTRIVDGRLSFESRSDKTFLVSLEVVPALNIQSNFSYELTLEFPTGNAIDQYGIIFGQVPVGASGGSDPLEYFTINNNKKMFMGNRTCYSFFTEVEKSQILSNGKNKLKVFKIGNMIYYFINNTYSYSSEIVTSQNINKIGFSVPVKGTVYVDNLILSTNSTLNTVSKVKQIQVVNFDITPIESIHQNQMLDQ